MTFRKQLTIKSICLLAAMLVSQPLLAEERIEEYSFEVEPDARLTVDTHRGEVNIRTADVNSIQVIATMQP